MNNKYIRLCFILSIGLLLEACAAALIVGGASGASIAADNRTTGTVIEDQAIELKALKAFANNEEISDKAHLNVTSYNTIVLVTGETPNETIRQQTIDILINIPKVSHVHNEITIAAPSSFMSRSSDSLITSKVKTKLLADRNIKGLSIKVVTDKGVVYLMGIINRHEANLATEVARQTGGVQMVVPKFEYTD